MYPPVCTTGPILKHMSDEIGGDITQYDILCRKISQHLEDMQCFPNDWSYKIMYGKEKDAVKDGPVGFNMQDTTCQVLMQYQRRMSSMINVKYLKPVTYSSSGEEQYSQSRA